MTQGLVRDPDGERLHLFYGADPMTHGPNGFRGPELTARVYRNRAVMRVDMRVDGFASYDAGYHFSANRSREALPQLLLRTSLMLYRPQGGLPDLQTCNAFWRHCSPTDPCIRR